MEDLVRTNMMALLGRAEAGLKSLPPYIYGSSDAHDAALALLVKELEAAGAKINDRPSWESSRMSFGGVRSTCTAGTTGAIHNWCAAVRKRLGLGAAA
jgi:hypothetical protein